MLGFKKLIGIADFFIYVFDLVLKKEFLHIKIVDLSGAWSPKLKQMTWSPRALKFLSWSPKPLWDPDPSVLQQSNHVFQFGTQPR